MFFAPVASARLTAPVYRAPAHALQAWDAVDAVFDHMFDTLMDRNAYRPWMPTPGLRVSSGDVGYTLSLDVPGLSKEQLQVNIEDSVVRIESIEGAPRTIRVAYRLPTEIDPAASSAKLEHGVLTLSLAKKPEVARGFKLEIA